mmetsp:Transcript_42043/g.88267  ORF Transcript_42043/g.88267 Transcript_42043/m.88267 type:complete len:241 (-) Transcript_42043:291-1013(-)
MVRTGSVIAIHRSHSAHDNRPSCVLDLPLEGSSGRVNHNPNLRSKAEVAHLIDTDFVGVDGGEATALRGWGGRFIRRVICRRLGRHWRRWGTCGVGRSRGIGRLWLSGMPCWSGCGKLCWRGCSAPFVPWIIAFARAFPTFTPLAAVSIAGTSSFPKRNASFKWTVGQPNFPAWSLAIFLIEVAKGAFIMMASLEVDSAASVSPAGGRISSGRSWVGSRDWCGTRSPRIGRRRSCRRTRR